MSKVVGFTILLGVVASVAVGVEVLRQGVFKSRLVYNTSDQRYLELTPDDDNLAVVRKLGQPAADRWRSETGAIQFRSLWYPQRGYFVILMGDSRSHTRYIGTMDAKWVPVHWVNLRSGGNTRSTLSSLDKF
jgi:hypothetical protein